MHADHDSAATGQLKQRSSELQERYFKWGEKQLKLGDKARRADGSDPSHLGRPTCVKGLVHRPKYHFLPPAGKSTAVSVELRCRSGFRSQRPKPYSRLTSVQNARYRLYVGFLNSKG